MSLKKNILLLIIWSAEMDLEIKSEIQKYNSVTNHEIK